MTGWRLLSFPGSLRVRRLQWPLVVLLASIGLTAVAATEAQRTVRSQRAVAELALREYANFAAWSYAQHLADTLSMIERDAVGAVNHGDNLHTNPAVPTASELAAYLPWSAECMCHRARTGVTPNAFFALQVGRRGFDASMNAPPSAATRGVVTAVEGEPQPYSPEEERWIVDSLTRRIRGLGESDHGFTLVAGRVANQPRYFVYTLMPTSWGDTMVYGARYSTESIARVLGGVLDGSGLLPATFTKGRPNRDVIAVRVRDRAGNPLFDSAPGVASQLAARVDLPSRAGLLSIEALVRPEAAGSLIIGGLPQSRLPFLFGLLGLAAALTIVAVMQLRREGELARLRADFVSSVSHELRTPVAQIRLYLETLQLGRASTDEQRRWSLGHIERETTRLSHLVENVLRFSSLGTADSTARERVDLGAEVRRIVDEYRPLAASRRAELRVDIEPAPDVLVRPDALRHIVLNLLDNAVKYGPAGQTVRVSVRTFADAHEHGAELAIDDEGPGVAPADRERIWRAFTRGTSAPANGGGGIGLTIVREVAESHGGSAHVESSPAGGARFVVRLPAAAHAGAVE